MNLLEEILNKILLKESVSIGNVNDAIDNHKRIIISYHTNGEDNNTGPRVVEVYAYGLTKAGNPVIRCFQPMGDTTSKVPSWKFFRLDRISSWKDTGQTFSRPADFYYKGLGNFNPDGDETMSVVYKIASFDDNEINKTKVNIKNGPKHKDTKIFRTDTEDRMERLKQQLNNPIKLSDLKTKQAFIDKNKTKNIDTTGPKQKTEPSKNIDNVQDTNDELTQFRDKLGDTSEPIRFADLKQRLSNNNVEQNKQNELPQWKKDVYDRFEPLRKQLENNPRKIDLSKIPKR